jgi:hypothetical protein
MSAPPCGEFPGLMEPLGKNTCMTLLSLFQAIGATVGAAMAAKLMDIAVAVADAGIPLTICRFCFPYANLSTPKQSIFVNVGGAAHVAVGEAAGKTFMSVCADVGEVGEDDIGNTLMSVCIDRVEVVVVGKTSIRVWIDTVVVCVVCVGGTKAMSV